MKGLAWPVAAGPLAGPGRARRRLLSWRTICSRYPCARVKLLPASDHAQSDFDAHLPFILQFLNLQDKPEPSTNECQA